MSSQPTFSAWSVPSPSGRAPSRREEIWVLSAACLASIAAIVFSWFREAFLFYGDAEAHMHIARRLFDSHRPGLGQLGSVWLPLPHLLLAPFVAIDPLWRSGFAPALPSAACYLFASIGLYRLARKWLPPTSACVAMIFFALNPNLLYLQSTAMTEPLFLCELIWSVLLLVEWHEKIQWHEKLNSTPASPWPVIAVLIAAVYTRYDGWILAFLAWAAMAVILFRRGRLLQRGFILASIVLALAPIAWMVYNAVLFGDWLDFMRGPYSAQAIELKTAGTAWPPHPGWHNPWVSLIFFVKAAELDSAAAVAGTFVVICSSLGAAATWLRKPSSHSSAAGKPSALWTLFLWLPLPFYAYSVSFGSVPIFLPVWWPHSWYNTRYGMEMLPAFALGLGAAAQLLLRQLDQPGHPGHPNPRLKRWRTAAVVLLFAALAANLFEMLHESPLVYVEGRKNSDARDFYNQAIPDTLRYLHSLAPQSLILTDTSAYPTIIPLAGLDYRQTLNESDKQFFQAALASPADHTPIVLAFAGDEVAAAVQAHPQHLIEYRIFHAKDQPDATLYVRDTFPGMNPEPQPAEGSTPSSPASPAR